MLCRLCLSLLALVGPVSAAAAQANGAIGTWKAQALLGPKDSVVIEAGPCPSSLKPGLTVTSFRTVAHVKGDTLTGHFVADYSNGEVHKGKIKATRAKS